MISGKCHKLSFVIKYSVFDKAVCRIILSINEYLGVPSSNKSTPMVCVYYRVKSGYFGHQVNLDIHLQTVEIQMRRLLMSRLIRIFPVCLVNLIFIPIIKL